VTAIVWTLRQALTGGLTETMVAHAYRGEHTRKQGNWARGDRLLPARGPVRRTGETMVGPVELARPYFSCTGCRLGVYPLDDALGLAAGRTQLDVQQAAAQLVIDVPYAEAQTLCSALTGVGLGSERMHTLTNHVAEGLTVLAVAPSRDEIERRLAAVAAGRHRRPVLVLGIDGADVPTRPASARGRRPGQGRQRAKRARWHGQWREAKGFRLSVMDGDRIVHLLSWHQVHHEAQRGEALQQVKKAGGIPADQVRLCVVEGGAPWRGKHGKALVPHARQGLDYSHCADSLHHGAKAQ
jgi:hypothetical protein